MELTWKDGVATALTGLVLLTYFAVSETWDVWLVGDSVRWAAAVILLLGLGAWWLGEPAHGRPSRPLAAVGGITAVLLLLALVTGSLTVLAWAVLGDLVLWLGATLRHAFGTGQRFAAP